MKRNTSFTALAAASILATTGCESKTADENRLIRDAAFAHEVLEDDERIEKEADGEKTGGDKEGRP